MVRVRLAAASRVAASTNAGFASNRSARKSSGVWTATPSAERHEVEVLQIVCHQHAGRDRRPGGGGVPILPMGLADRAVRVEPVDERAGKSVSDQWNGPCRYSLARQRLHVPEPFLFDELAPLRIEQVILRQLQQQVAQVVQVQDVRVKKRFYRAGLVLFKVFSRSSVSADNAAAKVHRRVLKLLEHRAPGIRATTRMRVAPPKANYPF
jgi:hypothetical protein